MRRPLALALMMLPLLAACDQKMAAPPRDDPYAVDPNLPGGIAAQAPVPGTVAREDPVADAPPPPVTAVLLDRGHERYDIFCVPCHGRSGSGDGLVVQRGFPHPPDFHDAALRNAPSRHFFDVITHGYGVMFPYGSRVPPADRWAIVAYIRALQLAGHAEVAMLPADIRARAEATP
jgi:mono/diheme cytochrome c family protein